MNLLDLNSDAMNIEDLKTMILVRKKKKDNGILKSSQELKHKWKRVKNNLEQTSEEHLRDQQFIEQIM